MGAGTGSDWLQQALELKDFQKNPNELLRRIYIFWEDRVRKKWRLLFQLSLAIASTVNEHG